MSGEVTVGRIDTSAFDTASLHSFLRGAFPNAVLLEEHQVSKLLCHMNATPPNRLTSSVNKLYLGYCNLSPSEC